MGRDGGSSGIARRSVRRSKRTRKKLASKALVASSPAASTSVSCDRRVVEEALGVALGLLGSCQHTDKTRYLSVHKEVSPMPKDTRSGRPTSRRGKVRKEFWLDPKTLREAQNVLGAETERETVEIALDLVAFRHEVETGLAALGGIELEPRD
jgi:hypothetical protein